MKFTQDPQNFSEINTLHCPKCDCTMLDTVDQENGIQSHYCYKCENEWDTEIRECKEATLFYAIS